MGLLRETEEALAEVVFFKEEPLLQRKLKQRCCSDYCWLEVGKCLRDDRNSFIKLAFDIHQLKQKRDRFQRVLTLAKWFNRLSEKYVLDLGIGEEEKKLEICKSALFHFIPMNGNDRDLLCIALLRRDDEAGKEGDKCMFMFLDEMENQLRKEQNTLAPNLVFARTDKAIAYKEFIQRFCTGVEKVARRRFNNFWLLHYPHMPAVGHRPVQENLEPEPEDVEYDQRPKVLLLGMTFSDETKLKESDTSGIEEAQQTALTASKPRGGMQEIEARDWVRAIATELVTKTKAYAVSLDTKADYRKDQHLCTDFSTQGFVNRLVGKFGALRDPNSQQQNNNNTSNNRRSARLGPPTPEINLDDYYPLSFRQIILDYFWAPNSWARQKWGPKLFEESLALLHGQLDIVTRTMGENTASANDANELQLPCAIYIPYLTHTFCQIVAVEERPPKGKEKQWLPLRNLYAIHFLRQSELGEVSLWKGTQEIEGDVMYKLGRKSIDEETKHCKVLKGLMLQDHKEESCVLLDQLEIHFHGKKLSDDDKDKDRIENPIRMIKLRPLKEGEQGGFWIGDSPITQERKRKGGTCSPPSKSKK